MTAGRYSSLIGVAGESTVNYPRPTTVDEAEFKVAAGHAAVVMSVGSDPDDPVCLIYRDQDEWRNQMIFTTSIGGWSKGVTEAICEPGSYFLERFFSEQGTESLVLIPLSWVSHWIGTP